MAVTDTQLYLAVGLPIFAIILSFIGGMMQNSALMSRFSSFENQMNSRFASLENQMNTRLGSLESRFDTLTGKVIEIDNRLTRVEAILERR